MFHLQLQSLPPYGGQFDSWVCRQMDTQLAYENIQTARDIVIGIAPDAIHEGITTHDLPLVLYQ